ncbi:hypothetical protein [Pacificibacter marinus]|uniref:hypothetical protein n=1 Tax=Pacificibacter marinus TaxID=658057 RepID=UPI001C071A3D|nr:hypothetical protein [Pacificibacter marinus]MBU2865949.1 hypothetical protein [Pacificibacter marinus]
MTLDMTFAPYVPWPFLAGVSAVLGVVLIIAALRGFKGWPLRALAFGAVLFALANPSILREERAPLTDIIVLLVDKTASQNLSARADQTEAAQARLEAQIARMPNTELRIVSVADAADNQGSLLMTRLRSVIADEPQGRLAGVFVITDGQIHDAGLAPDLPAPLHVLLTGTSNDWDRRLIVENAPAFAILDEEITLTLKVEDQGAVPVGLSATSPLIVSIDGGEDIVLEMPVGRAVQVPLKLPHGGMNVLQFSVPMAEGELTDRNNSSVIQINGVRDRLRVLLVSGEPHNGERTWRNLLKSDTSVDLVHFTILRPPEKQDGVPVTELSLISFPTRELFLEKIDDFDLIIFDRYKRRGILYANYFENIARYVEDGGAVLFSAGPDFASADSLYRSALARVIPTQPTGRVFDQAYRPQISELGLRHPVTQGLGGVTRPDVTPDWGRWFRQIDLDPAATTGDVIMTGNEGRPLLVVDHVGEGRVAVLASDHAWLWTRGIEGGGPQLELLRRLAHWMMKEPELEEESLSASATGNEITVTRRTLTEAPRSVTITAPDGTQQIVEMTQARPGLFQTVITGDDIGLYGLEQDGLSAVVVLGPAAPKEFEQTIATGALMETAVGQTRGGVFALSDGMPDLRRVSIGRAAAGRTWMGITPRAAYTAVSSSKMPLIPAWLWMVALSGWIIFMWLREGRR